MSVQVKQAEFIENFNFFDDWEDKYSFIISLGKSLPEYPNDKKDELHLVRGCQSQVWFDVEYKDGKLFFSGTSDALIVSGLIGMLIEVYSNQTPLDIKNSSTDFIKEMNLHHHLSSTRTNGLAAMLDYIYHYAKTYDERS